MKLRQLIRATENKYNRLLTTLILLYLVSPFLVDRKLGDFIVSFVFSLSLVLIVYQINRSKLAFRFNIGLVFLGLLFKSFGNLVSIDAEVSRWLELSSKLIFLAFIGLSVYSILRELTPRELLLILLKEGFAFIFCSISLGHLLMILCIFSM
jgi:hypothetical protein